MSGLPNQLPQVLLCGKIIWARNEVDRLRNQFEILELESKSREEFLSDCEPAGKYGGVTAIYRHNDSAQDIGIFDKELVKRLPDTVRFVCHNGAGVDQIDVQACTEKGIAVSNTPGVVNDATATTAMYLIIGALRRFSAAEKNARYGHFKSGLHPGHDPEGKVLGIVGMGGIGRALARRAIGFSMRILYHNRHPVPSEMLQLHNHSIRSYAPVFDLSQFVEYCPTLEELLSRSDVVSLNLPLNPETKGSFGTREFQLMKPGAVLVNTARGGIVDERAMLTALETGHLRSVGLDVYPSEPEINPVLRSNPNSILLPHMGTETEEAQYQTEVCALITNLENALMGKGLRNPIASKQS